MRRNAHCRWLRWCTIMEMHCLCFTSSLHTLDPRRAQMDLSSAPRQDWLAGSTTESPQGIEDLRQQNCWKLWKCNWLSVEHISYVLQMQQDATIKTILNFERTMDHVNWNRLSKLVGLTASSTQAIFKARMKAKQESCSSSSANDLLSLDIKRFCPQNVTYFQINLVHAMLERGLKTSEILHLASMPLEDGPTNYVEEKNQARTLSSEMSEEAKENTDFRNNTHNRLGAEGLADSFGQVTNNLGQKSARLFDLTQWLLKNQMVVDALGYCETKHMLLLVLELLEGATILENAGMLRNATESTVCRLENSENLYWRKAYSAVRMHRALCLKAALLGVLIHVPKRSVEFLVRNKMSPFGRSSNVYHVHICKNPSCTCLDFVCGVGSGYNHLPCKHLFYIYMVELSIEKDLEHLMHQAVLMEEDLERILSGHY